MCSGMYRTRSEPGRRIARHGTPLGRQKTGEGTTFREETATDRMRTQHLDPEFLKVLTADLGFLA